MNEIYLVSQHLGSGLLSLLLVDELHQDTLVLEHVTLGLQVQLVVKMTINLLGLTVTLEETPQNTHPFHPHFFLGHSGILGTFPLTVTGMTALATSFGVVTNTGPRMDSDRLLDHLQLRN